MDRTIHSLAFPFKTKLTIGSPNDKYEREADAMADRIMRMPMNSASGKPLSSGGPTIQTKCAACAHEEDKIQRKPLMMKSEGGAPVATQALGSQLNSSKGSGSPLPSGTNSFMSNAFGTDFSNVRVHTDSKAQQMNQGLNARAFAHGSDIYFNSGEYNPGSSEGKRLLGHELTHVVQQGEGGLNRINRFSSSSPSSRSSRSSRSSSSGAAQENDTVGEAAGRCHTSNCKVDVRATKISGLRFLPIYHLFIVYTNSCGVEFYYRGGPGGPAGPGTRCSGLPAGGYGSIQTNNGRYVPGTIDWAPGAPSTTVATGSAACGKDSCLRSEMSRIDTTCTAYAPLGPNSNTVVSTALSNCSLPRSKPVLIAPGFNDPNI